MLKRERSQAVAGRARQRTGTAAGADLFRRHRSAAGLRWWGRRGKRCRANVTVFDHASGALTLDEVTALTLDHPSLLEAAELFGLRIL